MISKIIMAPISEERLTQLIYTVIDELNPNFSDDEKIEKSMDAALFGQNGKLDSLGLVELMLQIEQKIYDDLNIPVSLAIENAMSKNENPFKTLGTLHRYIYHQLNP